MYEHKITYSLYEHIIRQGALISIETLDIFSMIWVRVRVRVGQNAAAYHYIKYIDVIIVQLIIRLDV